MTRRAHHRPVGPLPAAEALRTAAAPSRGRPTLRIAARLVLGVVAFGGILLLVTGRARSALVFFFLLAVFWDAFLGWGSGPPTPDRRAGDGWEYPQADRTRRLARLRRWWTWRAWPYLKHCPWMGHLVIDGPSKRPADRVCLWCETPTPNFRLGSLLDRRR